MRAPPHSPPPRQPGIIQSDEDNPENKTLVLDLVKGYIRESRTIIVAAVSCKDDANNQARAAAWAWWRAGWRCGDRALHFGGCGAGGRWQVCPTSPPANRASQQLLAQCLHTSSARARTHTVTPCTHVCLPIQAILDLAREADPKGQRTLGVLTKPDTIEEGTHSQWLPLLQGQRFGLDLGYYAVKNPSQARPPRGLPSSALGACAWCRVC
jgi:hypothetical protein